MATVTIDPTTGAATITPETPLAPGQSLKFALFDARKRRYLTTDDWAKTRKTFADVTTDDGPVRILVEPSMAARVPPGTPLVLEEIFVNLRENLTWPEPAKEPVAVPPVETPSTPSLSEPTPSPSPLPPPPPSTSRRWLAAGIGGFLAGAALVYGALHVMPASPVGTTPAAKPAAVSSPGADGANVQATVVTLQKQLDTSQQERGDAVRRVAALQMQIKNLQSEAADLRSKVSSTGANQSGAPSPTDGELATLRRSVDSLRAEQQRLQQLVQDRDRTIADLQAHQATGPDAGRIAELEQEVSKWNWEANVERDKAFKAEQQIRDLQATIQSLKNAAPAPAVSGASPTQNIPSGTWVAAAVSGTGSVHVVVNQATAGDASDAAIAKCRTTGARSCQLLETYPNGCFAVARPAGQRIMPGNFWYDRGMTEVDAERRALVQCNQNSSFDLRAASCRVAFSACSGPE